MKSKLVIASAPEEECEELCPTCSGFVPQSGIDDYEAGDPDLGNDFLGAPGFLSFYRENKSLITP